MFKENEWKEKQNKICSTSCDESTIFCCVCFFNVTHRRIVFAIYLIVFFLFVWFCTWLKLFLYLSRTLTADKYCLIVRAGQIVAKTFIRTYICLCICAYIHICIKKLQCTCLHCECDYFCSFYGIRCFTKSSSFAGWK